MRYVSTRGEAPPVSFDELLLTGLAPDGGLYVPDEWPSLGGKGIRDLAGLPYADVVRRVTAPYVGDAIPPEDLERMISEAYTRFD
ncbi:MAG: threonine synthase, partial [Rhodospirillaceae bacterium]|nr:threonine synthase [Rhodospirillaceae bacterium]